VMTDATDSTATGTVKECLCGFNIEWSGTEWHHIDSGSAWCYDDDHSDLGKATPL
jgi:hypothetical protein